MGTRSVVKTVTENDHGSHELGDEHKPVTLGTMVQVSTWTSEPFVIREVERLEVSRARNDKHAAAQGEQCDDEERQG